MNQIPVTIWEKDKQVKKNAPYSDKDLRKTWTGTHQRRHEEINQDQISTNPWEAAMQNNSSSEAETIHLTSFCGIYIS